MKKTILSFALLGVCSIASAQLSTRENQDTRYKLGGRPVAGDMAIVLGISLGSDSLDFGTGSANSSVAWNRLSRGNLITVKKYISDDVAYRLGLRLTRNSRSINGEVDSVPDHIDASLAEFEFKSSTREYMIAPGIEKHFSSANIFDVYMAGDLFLGFGRSKSLTSYVYRDYSTAPDDDITEETTPYTILGIGGIIGVNVFVLDLPISVGVEYGLSAFWELGNKTHVEKTLGDDSWEYYTVADDPNTTGTANSQYSSVKQKFMTMDSNSQVRLTANIYFN